MDRLSTLIIILVSFIDLMIWTGCENPKTDVAPSSGRFDTVEQSQNNEGDTLHRYCDLVHNESTAPMWNYPQLEGPALQNNPERPTWINFWATWCEPCIHEMPMLREELSQSNTRLVFISADAHPEDLNRYRTTHQVQDVNHRLVDATSLTSALSAIGYRGTASLPVHIMVNQLGKVRCIRAGAVEKTHIRDIVTALGFGNLNRRMIR